jgi:Flp pilus assembly protein TadD
MLTPSPRMSSPSISKLKARRFGEAIDWADRSLREQPRNASAYRLKAVACAHLDRAEEARECTRRVLELQPAFTISGCSAQSGRS